MRSMNRNVERYHEGERGLLEAIESVTGVRATTFRLLQGCDGVMDTMLFDGGGVADLGRLAAGEIDVKDRRC